MCEWSGVAMVGKVCEWSEVAQWERWKNGEVAFGFEIIASELVTLNCLY